MCRPPLGASVGAWRSQAPWHGGRVGDTPGRHAVRHGRGACLARGLVSLVPAPDDRADLSCDRERPWRWPRRVRPGVALAGDRPIGGHWRTPARRPGGGRCSPSHAVASGVGRWWASRVRRRYGPASPGGVSHMRRERGARAARLWGMEPASPPCVGGEAPSRLLPACVRVSLACARGRAVRVRGGGVQAGCRGASWDGAGPEAGAQRGPTTHWSRPRQWEFCGIRVPYLARRLTAGVGH
jgi:hypothetical protein